MSVDVYLKALDLLVRACLLGCLGSLLQDLVGVYVVSVELEYDL